MQPLNPAPRDPAPSRLRYRMQRWMLTPGIRNMVRIGLPLAVVVGVVGGYLADQERRDGLMLMVGDLRASIEQRPEFMVGLMAIDGASPGLMDDIREVVPLDFPISSFDLDLEQIRIAISGLDPVKSASVRVRPGGVLQVDVIARTPEIVWRTRDRIELLDKGGAHIEIINSRQEHPDLPLVAGEGADRVISEALALFQAAAPLGDRMRGLVRVGERRWDVVLDRDQRIQLPPERPVRALERVLALNEAQDMLERDVAVIDMRLGERPTLRMTADAVENWWRIRKTNGNGQ